MQINICALNSLDHDGNPRHQEIYVKWKFPSSGAIKLNIDGAFCQMKEKLATMGCSEMIKANGCLDTTDMLGIHFLQMQKYSYLEHSQGLIIAKENN